MSLTSAIALTIAAIAMVLIIAYLLLADRETSFQEFIEWLSQRHALFWNTMVGVTIALGAIKYLLRK